MKKLVSHNSLFHVKCYGSWNQMPYILNWFISYFLLSFKIKSCCMFKPVLQGQCVRLRPEGVIPVILMNSFFIMMCLFLLVHSRI